ncbi:heterokaryon incompatibility protein-domain-containing protein [Apodospora peruviana]|uniref:Heterokaryon incompatibility protein-domain-containing protein n=1 Tax=Apodospora peruviana TaxID=516989 RepID=A0AAE0MD96_9PEZI|nr:heterokaryon incompatibility protein-domain-containing protein [Apodospora peruviana]
MATPSHAGAFQYRPLTELDTIRTLVLDPGSDGLPLSFTLEHQLFDGKLTHGIETICTNTGIPYIAISYTWDDQPFDHEATCEGHIFKITKNCHDILSQLRHESSTVRIWIDQICIDQNSDKDKSDNVRQMARIFNGAKAVIVWTGPCDSETVGVFSRVVGDGGCLPLPDSLADLKAPFKFSAVRLPENSTHYNALEGDSDVIAAFEARNWFKRMWTLQEVAMVAHSSVWFVAGDHIFSMERMAATAMFIRSIAYTKIAELWATKMQFCIRFWFMVTEPCPSAFTFFSRARHRRCSLAHDKVFSLCGMAERGEYLEKMQSGFPDPDYARPVADVYKDAAVWALTRQQHLEFLYHAVMSSSEISQTSPTTPSLPSWVPDLMRLSAVQRRGVPILTLHSLDRWHSFNAFPGANPVPESIWDASRPPPVTIPSPPTMTPDSTLILTGITLDTIAHLSQEIPQLPDDFGVRQELDLAAGWSLHAGLALVDFFSRPEVRANLGNDSDRLFRTVQLIPDTVDTTEQEPAIRQFCDYLLSDGILDIDVAQRESDQVLLDAPWLAIYRLDEDTSYEGMDLDSEDFVEAREAVDMLKWFLRRFSVLEKCVFFMTEKGSLGVAFGAIEKGDKIALARGLDRLLLLRPEKELFRLVGHGFVEGYMDGSRWPAAAEELGEISIC